MKRRTFLTVALAAVSGVISGAASKVHAAVANVCSKLTASRRVLLPPIPRWNKITDDIDSADFFNRAQDYERSLLPKNLVFPRAGQIWESVAECDVSILRYMNNQKRPAVWLGGPFRLAPKQRVRILTLDHPKPLQIRFELLGDDSSQGNFAPETVRYEFVLRTGPTLPTPGCTTGYFTDFFRLVEDMG